MTEPQPRRGRHVEFRAVGVPVTEGSTRAFTDRAGRTQVRHDNAAGLHAWRELLRARSLEAARLVRWPVGFDGPVEVEATFFLPRPQRPSFEVAATKPDLDKLQRGVGDALGQVRRGRVIVQQGLLREDSRIVAWTSRKAYASVSNPPGALVRVTRA